MNHDLQANILVIPSYIPQFLWKFWISYTNATGDSFDEHRLHIYDVHNNILSEIRRIPAQNRSIFRDLHTTYLDDVSQDALFNVEEAFTRLESETSSILEDLVGKAAAQVTEDSTALCKFKIPISRRSLDVLRTFFAFLSFRNGPKYHSVVSSLASLILKDRQYSDAMIKVQLLRWKAIICAFREYLENGISGPANQRLVDMNCWRFRNADILIGVTSHGQEFSLTDSCFGNLDEDSTGTLSSGQLFFPVTPNMAIYVLENEGKEPELHQSKRLQKDLDISSQWIACGVEESIDVHLRNASLLQSYPRYLHFSSLVSVVRSISCYDEFRQLPEHLDYSRLKQRCRQKYAQESVTTTLLVKASMRLVDLTKQVERLGNSAVCYGSFSDVWKGVWRAPACETRLVALKYLRQFVKDNAREKFWKRLDQEVEAWHRLQHPNVAELCGIVKEDTSIALVSRWCNNGTIVRYLREANPTANRLALLVQIASAVSYLHNFKPVVIHADLKGCNILIGDEGQALVTDFGLSRVAQDLGDSVDIGGSWFAGSTRWMAPELMLALVEDDERPPPITKASDVYAFASVCLEVATGQLPYPQRTNDHAVTVDVMRGVKPSRGTSRCLLDLSDDYENMFWHLMNRCWDADWADLGWWSNADLVVRH